MWLSKNRKIVLYLSVMAISLGISISFVNNSKETENEESSSNDIASQVNKGDNLDEQVTEVTDINSKEGADEIEVEPLVPLAVRVPDAYVSEGRINSSSELNQFIESCGSRFITFPYSREVVFDGPIIIQNLEDKVIDFNSTTFLFADDFEGWGYREQRPNDIYVGNSLICILNNTRLKIKNLVIDGNKQNISPDVSCIGLWAENGQELDFENLKVVNTGFHGIVISKNTKDFTFNQLYLENNYGSDNSSDVYIINDSLSNCDFKHVMASRDALVGDQVFYIDGYNTDIESFHAYNCNIGIDYRRGSHKARLLTFDTCNSTVHIQSTSNIDLPQVEIEDIVGENLMAGSNTRSGLGIWDAKFVHIENVYLEYAEEATTNQWGIVIRRFSDNDTIEEVVIDELTIVNTKFASIHYDNLTSPTTIKKLKVKGIEEYVYRVDQCEGSQLIEEIIFMDIPFWERFKNLDKIIYDNEGIVQVSSFDFEN